MHMARREKQKQISAQAACWSCWCFGGIFLSGKEMYLEENLNTNYKRYVGAKCKELQWEPRVLLCGQEWEMCVEVSFQVSVICSVKYKT